MASSRLMLWESGCSKTEPMPTESESSRYREAAARSAGASGLRDTPSSRSWRRQVCANELLHLRLEESGLPRAAHPGQPATSKSRRERFVTMHPEAARATGPLSRTAGSASPSRSSIAFTIRSARPFTRQGMATIVHGLKHRTGMRDLYAHQLRHLWAIYRAGAGDLFDLQEEGGWSPAHGAAVKGGPLTERRRMPSC